MAESFEIRRYDAATDAMRWNDFIACSRNGTFIFDRNYMDYHADRFTDSSLMAFRSGRLQAVLPANITPDGVLHSHQGLTYGGWVLPQGHLNGDDVVRLMSDMTAYCRSVGLKGVDYKPVPYIYAYVPSQEDLYALFRCGAGLTETNLSSAIRLPFQQGFNAMMRRHLRSALKLNPVIVENEDVAQFWHMLDRCLSERHGASPVHSLDELSLLKMRFPENIRLFTITEPGVSEPSAGVCIYDTGRVVHCQYIATTERGRRTNLLVALFNYLINDVFAGRRYFDFGTSNEDGGRYLNEGLLRQKTSLGGSGVVHQRFYLSL